MKAVFAGGSGASSAGKVVLIFQTEDSAGEARLFDVSALL
jgi:hypothetical protein